MGNNNKIPEQSQQNSGAKSGNGLLIVLIVLLAAIIVFIGFQIAAMRKPSAGSGKAPKERVLHSSANGIDTMDNGYMRTELTAVELTKLMGNGVNLGNTMEAYGHFSLGTQAPVASYETLWGQPVTTQEIITKLKESGFDSIRIPVAWTNAIAFESGDYTIREDYLDRVEEIINYALNEEMYVVINDHWDGSWWGMFGSATQETRDRAMDMYISMWTQIAERYKEYSDYLIFESANEELGERLNDMDIAKDSGNLTTDECYALTNKINQTFVDTVRKTGGNNAQRFLLIAGYGTDIEDTCDSRYVMPTDTAQNKLLVSVHYYTPFSYCGSASLSSWGTVKQYNQQNDLLAMMTKFTDAGYGVIIGEYAVALKEDGSVKNNTCDFINNFLNNCDIYGYCPMLWDCSSLFVRRNLSWLDPEVEELFKSRSYSAQAGLSEEALREQATEQMNAALAAAPESLDGLSAGAEADQAIAWLMFTSGDWNVGYSVGDEYNPSEKTEGIVNTDVEITEAGTYTVSLDFTQTAGGSANGMTFCAIGISNGEQLYPGYLIEIVDFQIDGKEYPLLAEGYTTTDDGKCTRLNVYNGWVKSIPAEARIAGGDFTNASPCLVDPEELGNIQSISITFEYKPAE